MLTTRIEKVTSRFKNNPLKSYTPYEHTIITIILFLKIQKKEIMII